MGCGGSTIVKPPVDATTVHFDRILEEQKAESELHFKLLTLGAGESGKSTIIKQLVFLHKQAETSEEEKQAYVRVLHGNVLTCINTLITETNNFHYDFGEYSDRVDLIEAFDTRNLLSLEVVNAINDLWYHSDAIRKTWERRSEYWILEGCEYYFENMNRFAEEGYVPTEEDIVLARKRTTGVVETQLKYGGVDWSVVDVGGQRSERRKWMNSFEGVKGILFCVNLAGFCSVLFEDRNVNRMQESLKLFEETMSNPIFAETPVFLILNKKDLFERLIETKSLRMAFPEYDGPQELRPCIEYIAHKYASVLKPTRPKPMVLLMAARLKRDVKYCFEDIRETLLDANSKDVRKAKARLDELREKRKAEQLEEMEQKAAERRQAEEQRLKEAKENGTKGHANGNGATKGSLKNGAAR